MLGFLLLGRFVICGRCVAGAHCKEVRKQTEFHGVQSAARPLIHPKVTRGSLFFLFVFFQTRTSHTPHTQSIDCNLCVMPSGSLVAEKQRWDVKALAVPVPTVPGTAIQPQRGHRGATEGPQSCCLLTIPRICCPRVNAPRLGHAACGLGRGK